MRHFILLIISLVLLQACTQAQTQNESIDFSLHENFGDYWYQGEAELSHYDLTQVRYVEKREGRAVLIFVTEDFSKSKQVKLDNPQAAGDDVEKVLKLNFTKKFKTGVYPYSLMSSVFSPVYPKNDLHVRKITTSVQEWCGHVFMQMNNENNHYRTLVRSYFESEGDVNKDIPKTWTEDELWNMIRLNPEQLPTGKLQLIPSTQYLRLKHKELKSHQATINIQTNDFLKTLNIEYPELQRSVAIQFQAAFPHKIQSWEEKYPEGGEIMSTIATLNQRIMLDYWNKNSLKDSTYRSKLNLDY